MTEGTATEEYIDRAPRSGRAAERAKRILKAYHSLQRDACVQAGGSRTSWRSEQDAVLAASAFVTIGALLENFPDIVADHLEEKAAEEGLRRECSHLYACLRDIHIPDLWLAESQASQWSSSIWVYFAKLIALEVDEPAVFGRPITPPSLDQQREALWLQCHDFGMIPARWVRGSRWWPFSRLQYIPRSVIAVEEMPTAEELEPRMAA